MAESKHTPGPWVAENYDSWEEGVGVVASNKSGEISNPSRGMVAWISTIAGASFENEQLALANARLIAAAPDLLKALRALVAVHRALDTVGAMPADKAIAYGQAEAAIAKAIGG